MTFTDVFGGSPVQPAEVMYSAITLSANVSLVWPLDGVTGTVVAARIMDITPTAGTYTVKMPDAREVGDGTDILFRNPGSFPFVVADSTGSAIVTVGAGTAWYVYLTTNTAAAGTWASVQFGSTTSSANAGALAGLGTVAIGSILGTGYAVNTTASNYSFQTADRAKLEVWTGGSGTFTLLPSATAGNNWFILVANQGTGALTIAAAGGETVDGSSSIALNPTESCAIISSGSAYYTVGRGRSVNFTTTMLVKDVSGSGTVSLTSSEAGNIIQKYTGTLTGNRIINVPAAVNIYYVFNNTTGAYTLTVKTPSGTGVAISTSQRSIVYCDGTNVILADTGAPVAPTTFPDGSAGAPSIAFASEPNTGFYRASAGHLGTSILGANVLMVTASGLAVTGAATVSTTLGVTGATTLSSTLGVTGAATLSSTLAVTGAATLSSTLTATGTVTTPTIASTGALSISPTTYAIATRAALTTVTAITFASTMTPDFQVSNDFTIAMTGNATLANPSNLAVGQEGSIRISQDGTGSRTLAYGNQYKFSGSGVLSTTASAVDVLVYKVMSSNEVLCVLVKGFA